MNSLIICNTPYQIMNAVNIIVNNVAGITKEGTDILIDKVFKNADIIGNRLLKEKIVNNVYYADHIKEVPKRSKFKCLIDLVMGDFHEETLDYSYELRKENQYDTIWVGDTNSLGLILYGRNRKAKIFWYDDGVASYSKPPEAFNHTTIYCLFASFLKLGGYKYSSNLIYLNNPEMIQYSGYLARQLPQYTSDNKATEMLNYVFNYQKKYSLLDQYKTIILTQVLPLSAEYEGIDAPKLFSGTHADLSSLLIRKHPRDTKEYQNCRIDSGLNMWEMECLNGITDDHVLIACCSTAQITPKMLAGKEPYVYFLHRFLLGENSTIKDGFEKLVNSIKEMYFHKEKIIVPDSIDAFRESISKIIL